MPVLIDNDVNIMALGEQHAHLPDVEDLVFIKVSTGIGAGLISGGELQRGAQGTAGDLGHVGSPAPTTSPAAAATRAVSRRSPPCPPLAAALRGGRVSTRRGDQDVVELVRGGDLAAVAGRCARPAATSARCWRCWST